MTDKLTPQELDAFRTLAKRYDDPKVTAAIEHSMKAEFADDPTRPPLGLLTADEIMEGDWPEPQWGVEDFLPASSALLSALPKHGKTFFGLQIAKAIASGGELFGRKVQQGPALLLTLEDNEMSLKEKMRLQKWPKGLPVDCMVMGEYARDVGDLRNGGGETLAHWIETRGYKYILLDTLGRAFMGRKIDYNDYGEMINALGPVQEMSLNKQCLTMITDHMNKGAHSVQDVLINTLGSIGKIAVCNTIMGLYKGEGKGAKLMMEGNFILPQTLNLIWDGFTCQWLLEGVEGDFTITEKRQEIIDALKALGESQVGDVAEATEQSKGNVYNRFVDMVNAGIVLRKTKDNGDVTYRLNPNHQVALV